MDYKNLKQELDSELEYAKQVRLAYKKEKENQKIGIIFLFLVATFGFSFLLNRLIPDASFFEILGWWGLVNYGLMALKSYAN